MRDKLREIREDAEWWATDPKVDEADPGNGLNDDSVVKRLFRAGTGQVVVEGGLGGARVTRFDDDGWARSQTWTVRRSSESILRALTAAGVSEQDAQLIVAQMEPLILARWPEPRPESRRWRITAQFGSVYAVPWGIGIAWIAAMLVRVGRSALRHRQGA
jgi:hypothetical protein